MICERCGYEKSNEFTVCPACGTASTRGRETVQPATSYGPHPYNKDASLYYPGQALQQIQGTSQQPQAAYTPSYTPARQLTVTRKDNTPLFIEITLSLFGIFGVGWLFARETTIGVILLLCSFLVYWPIMLIGTVLTFGLGLLLLGPLAICAIIVNALLFTMILNRRASQFGAIPPSRIPPPQ